MIYEIGSSPVLTGAGGDPVPIWAVGFTSDGLDLMACFPIIFFKKIFLTCHVSRSEPLEVNPTVQMGQGPLLFLLGGDPNPIEMIIINNNWNDTW